MPLGLPREGRVEAGECHAIHHRAHQVNAIERFDSGRAVCNDADGAGGGDGRDRGIAPTLLARL